MRNRKPNRLKNYDYSNAGWYYLTLCTQDRESYFGEIKNNRMYLNEIGKIADECWNKIAIFHTNIELDYHVVMPNHIHGIIIIDKAKLPESLSRSKMELSKLIQQFKRAVTMKTKAINPYSKFRWQRSFHDRIIRNENELFYIRKYIQQNPLKWDLKP